MSLPEIYDRKSVERSEGYVWHASVPTEIYGGIYDTVSYFST